MRYKFTKKISRRLFWGALLLMPSVTCLVCKKPRITHPHTKPGRVAKGRKVSTRKVSTKEKSSKEAKPLFSLSLRPSNGLFHYVIITINPPAADTFLSQYQVAACPAKGAGICWAPSEKKNRRFQYNIPLNNPSSLDSLFPEKGSKEDFEQAGKSITFKCRYQPEATIQEGEAHQLKVTILRTDEKGALLQEEEQVLDLPAKKAK
jgi:hypothetical protein